MIAQNQKIEEIVKDFFTREDIAKWYCISERGLRLRFQKAKLSIKHRVLTLMDILIIFQALGKPQLCPRYVLLELQNLVVLFSAT